MNRALRAATLGVALLFPVTLTACSAGQVTQTATQDRDQTGATAQVDTITLRTVQLINPTGGSYDAGDDAELRMAIVNTADETDTLVSVDGEGFRSAELSGSSTSTTGGGTPTGSAGAATTGEIELPPRSTVFVGEDDATVTLTDLDEALTVGQYVTLVLTFENAGEVTVRATVATPDDVVDRGETFDFHYGEGDEGGGAAEDVARNRESDAGRSD